MVAADRGLDAKTLADARERLMAERARLLRLVAITGEELVTLEGHQPGAADEDAPTEAVRVVLDRLEDREKRELEEIHAAWARLEAGTYGACLACGAAMPVERLRAVPAARYCVTCQAAREREGGAP